MARLNSTADIEAKGIYRWANAEQTTLIFLDGDQTWFIPADPSNRHYAAYLASGETAEPYVEPPAPPEPTTAEKVERMFAAYGLTQEEFNTYQAETLAAKAKTPQTKSSGRKKS